MQYKQNWWDVERGHVNPHESENFFGDGTTSLMHVEPNDGDQKEDMSEADVEQIQQQWKPQGEVVRLSGCKPLQEEHPGLFVKPVPSMKEDMER